jgi:DNA-binding NarL/FixJ family response regulator
VTGAEPASAKGAAPEPATVLIADDHLPTRVDIRSILEEDGRFRVLWEAADAPSAITAAVEGRPQVCLLDVRMPGGGVAAAWEISARLPDTKIVMLTVSRDDMDLFAALRAGASGYLLKDIDPDRLPDTLESVLAGESALPGSLVARLVAEFRDRSPRRRAIVSEGEGSTLTSREWQVLDLMRQGMTTAQIARRLVVSPATVRSHVASMLKKLRVPDRESALKLFDSTGSE